MFERRGVDSNCSLMLERTVYNYAVRTSDREAISKILAKHQIRSPYIRVGSAACCAI